MEASVSPKNSTFSETWYDNDDNLTRKKKTVFFRFKKLLKSKLKKVMEEDKIGGYMSLENWFGRDFRDGNDENSELDPDWRPRQLVFAIQPNHHYTFSLSCLLEKNGTTWITKFSFQFNLSRVTKKWLDCSIY